MHATQVRKITVEIKKIERGLMLNQSNQEYLLPFVSARTC